MLRKPLNRLLSRNPKPLEGKTTASEEGGPYLIVGLGNPGREYRQNRHNAGFLVVDAFAAANGINLSRVQSRAITGQGQVAGRRVILAKPQTYMNLSGESAAPLVRYFRVPQSCFLLIHDDIDLPFGSLRLRPGGGAGGQRGVASVIDRLGTADFARLRVGIGRPPGQKQAASYVLEDFLPDEREVLQMVIDQAVQAVELFVLEGLDTAMNRFNGVVA